jgi:hypothetical protein
MNYLASFGFSALFFIPFWIVAFRQEYWDALKFHRDLKWWQCLVIWTYTVAGCVSFGKITSMIFT